MGPRRPGSQPPHPSLEPGGSGVSSGRSPGLPPPQLPRARARSRSRSAGSCRLPAAASPGSAPLPAAPARAPAAASCCRAGAAPCWRRGALQGRAAGAGRCGAGARATGWAGEGEESRPRAQEAPPPFPPQTAQVPRPRPSPPLPVSPAPWQGRGGSCGALRWRAGGVPPLPTGLVPEAGPDVAAGTAGGRSGKPGPAMNKKGGGGWQSSLGGAYAGNPGIRGTHACTHARTYMPLGPAHRTQASSAQTRTEPRCVVHTQ